jgi:fused signal recognition particle receptor
MLKWFHRKSAEEQPEPDGSLGKDDILEAEAEGEACKDIQGADDVESACEPAEAVPEDILPGSEIEEIEPGRAGLFSRLKNRLGHTRSSMVGSVLSAFGRYGKMDEDLLEEIEDILIQCDVGVETTLKIVTRMRKEGGKQGVQDADGLVALFKESIDEIMGNQNRFLDFEAARPMILLIVGVNGAGKTTTIGKLGKMLSDKGLKVMMVAADTFRAAAADQLTIWAEKTGSCIVKREEGADPASVVFEALEGVKKGPEPDVILIDTAGRLHTKLNLMEQLSKMVRIIRKHFPEAPHETILVLDATTGQNALNQVRLFDEACELSGLVMTKLDGTAKGGILIAVRDLYGFPIFKIGIGEEAEDLRDFNPREYVEALFSNLEEAVASPEPPENEA